MVLSVDAVRLLDTPVPSWDLGNEIILRFLQGTQSHPYSMKYQHAMQRDVRILHYDD